MPSFNFKSQLPIADIINAIQRKPQMEQQIAQSQDEMRQARLKGLLDTLSTGASVARSISANKSEAAQTAQTQLQNAALTSQQQGQQALSGLTQAANYPATPTPLAPAPPQMGPDGNPLPAPPMQTFGQTPGYQEQLKAALMKASPSAYTSAMAQNLAPKSLDQIMAEQVQAGTLSLPQAAAMKNAFNPQFNISTDPSTGLRQAVNTKNPYAAPVNIDNPGGAPPVAPALPGMSPTTPSGQPPAFIPPPPPPSAAKPPAAFNPKQVEYIGQAATNFQQLPEVKESTQALSLVDAAKKALQSNNPANLTNLRIAIARTSGVSPGSLTSNEIAGEAGSKALGAKSQRFLTQLFSGKLSSTDVADFNALLDDRKSSAQTVLANTLQDHADAFAAIHPDVGADRAKNVLGLPVRRYLRDYVPGQSGGQGGGTIKTVSSEAEAHALPVGTRFSLNGRTGTVQ